MSSFNGLGLHLGNLHQLSNARTRSISAENFTGEKGKGGMATEGTGAGASRDLGRGWKVSPSIVIKPKEEREVANIAGPGAIQQIWMTTHRQLAMGHPSHLLGRLDHAQRRVPRRRLLRLRLGQVRPRLVAPGLRQSRQRVQLLLDHALPHADVASPCRTWMTKDMVLYYQINYTLTDVPEDAAYFHAQFRRVNPLPYKQVYTILDNVTGRGHYVGTYLAWGVHNNGWWGEGEIKFFMDGDTEFPTICGTGTEDYFCGSYDFDVRKKNEHGVETVGLPGIHHALRRPGPGSPRRWPLSDRPALRPVSLAHHGPDPLRAEPPRDDPGLRLAQRRAIPASPG
jgi:hypothetical protein